MRFPSHYNTRIIRKNTIMELSVHGERNSGTCYLRDLLEYNFSNTMLNSMKIITLNRRYFRHNIPKISEYPRPEQTLVIHVVRNLHSWITSCYHNPYSLAIDPKVDHAFATKPLTLDQLSRVTLFPHHITAYDHLSYSLIERRYLMWKEFTAWQKRRVMPHVVLVNLSAVQRQPQAFLDFLQRKYKLQRKPGAMPWITQFKHTKLLKDNIQNRNYEKQIHIPSEFIDDVLEREISELTWK